MKPLVPVFCQALVCLASAAAPALALAQPAAPAVLTAPEDEPTDSAPGSAASAASAAAAAAPAKAQWVLSADGAYAIDQRAQLAWPRCVHGMRWNGRTCTGQPLLLTYTEAAALATARWKAEGVRWRLPRVNELRRLVNKRADPPGIDPELFPNAPQDWHWTGTANIKTFSVNAYKYDNVQQGNSDRSANQMAFTQGWAVDLSSGEARGDIATSELLPVRLVRPRP